MVKKGQIFMAEICLFFISFQMELLMRTGLIQIAEKIIIVL